MLEENEISSVYYIIFSSINKKPYYLIGINRGRYCRIDNIINFI